METQQLILLKETEFPVSTGKRERPVWRNITSLPPTEEVAHCIKTMVYSKRLTSNHNTQRGEGDSLLFYQEKDGADGSDFEPTNRVLVYCEVVFKDSRAVHGVANSLETVRMSRSHVVCLGSQLHVTL